MERVKKRFGAAIKVPFKAGFWYTLSGIMTKGISLLCTPVFTRLMSEAEYAVYPLYLSKLGIVSALGGIEALGTAMLVGMQKFSDRKNEFIRSAIALECGIIGAICLLYFAFYGIFGDFGFGGRLMSLVIFLQVLLDGIIGIILLARRYEYKYLTVFSANVLSSLGAAALGIFITKRFSLGGEGRIAALLLVSAVVAFVLLLGYAPSEPLADAQIVRYLVRRALPLIPQGLGVALLAAVDRLMISRYFGGAELAKYSVAHSLGVSVCFLSSAMIMALRPWILRRLHAEEPDRIREVVSLGVKILCVPVLAVICVAPEGMRLLAPAGYLEALSVVPLTALSVLPDFLGSVMATSLIYHGGGGRAILPVGAGVGANILLNVIFFRSLPYTVAAMSSLLAGCVSLAVWGLVYRRVTSSQMISLRSFAASFIICCALAVGIFFLAKLPSVRYMILALVIIAPIPVYKRAIELIKE